MNKAYCYLVMLACAFVVLACEPSTYVGVDIAGPGLSGGVRDENVRDYIQEERNVLLLYSAGYNSISNYLAEDINDLLSGELPGQGRMDDVLLIYSHLTTARGAYNMPTSPVLTRVYKDFKNNIIKDTLVVYPEGTRSASALQLNQVLTYVRDNYPAKTYGMIFSSHATGYLPAGYYSNPKGYVYNPPAAVSSLAGGCGFAGPNGVPYVEPEHDPTLPMVKSIGQDQVGTYGNYLSYEIELGDFARALPMYMDYILFDACLMGGVEVAYELSGRCGLVGFSQTEVLAEGFDYKSLTSHLLCGGTPDPEAVCRDYFNQYDVQQGINRSATISLVDCSRMEPLAQVCAGLFAKYRSAMALLRWIDVQRYYRSDYHWFYDLKDILIKAGANTEELSALDQAIQDCVVYGANTPEFMNSFKISVYSGFSMYLPCNGEPELDSYYRTLRWNVATGLVK